MNTKDNWLTTATIHDEHRAAVWGSIFPGARLPILSILPSKADLPGHPGAFVYLLDLNAISDEQREKMISYLAGIFNEAEDEVRRDLHLGVPILAEGVTVETRDPALFFSMALDDDGFVSRLSDLYEQEDGHEL